ncbi:MAG: hypothetical protein WCG90_05465 [Chitinophagia bacterium]
MIPTIRAAFNAQFTPEKYQQYLSILNAPFKDSIPFRIAETPVFIDKNFKAQLLEAGKYICQFITDSNCSEKTMHAIPKDLLIPNEQAFPECIVIDFAIAEGLDGTIQPQLIELQGFPSLFAFELLQTQALALAYDMPKGFSPFLNGYNETSYLDFFRTMVLGDQGKHTILLELNPFEQKTKLDLLLTEAWLNVPIVCLSEIYLKDKTLYYQKNWIEYKIERIYNRVVYDELMQQAPHFLAQFKLFEQAENIEWVNHPHHFFRISKYMLPLLKHPAIPEAYLLADWKKNHALLGLDLSAYVCKPLFSFGGHGVMLHPTIDALTKIDDPENWILQKRVSYAAVIETPSGPSKAEIRLFYFWDKNLNRYMATNNLTRISKGPMIGVSYNDTATWIGGSISYFEV